MKPLLYIFAGLPGVGKSTLATALARDRAAVYLRIDTIEKAIGTRNHEDLADRGYLVAYDIAVDNLRLGRGVVADSANTVELTRAAWRRVATSVGAAYVEIEVICSDETEHRRRLELRSRTNGHEPGLAWESVQAREHDPWVEDHVVLDTAGSSVKESTVALLAMLNKHSV